MRTIARALAAGLALLGSMGLAISDEWREDADPFAFPGERAYEAVPEEDYGDRFDEERFPDGAYGYRSDEELRYRYRSDEEVRYGYWSDEELRYGDDPFPDGAYGYEADDEVRPGWARGYAADEAVRIPPRHLPPPGECRTWYPDRPPGHQPPPHRC